jgi:glutamine amidotransferase
MCRHLAYLGPAVSLREAIIDPPYGLYRQAWAPQMMRGSGTMNIDGFGAGWYADGDPVPARYRNSGPIWADPSFADLTRVTRSGALLAAVRDASAGTEASPSAASPFGADHWLFSHNGALVGWPGTAAGLAATLSPLWALTLKRLRDGARPDEALAAVIGLLDVAGVTGRFNFLLTDGHEIAATTAGHSLFYRQGHRAEDGADSVTVASEPADEEPGWIEVPDRSLLAATRTDVKIRSLPVPPEVTADDAERVQRGSFPEGMAATSSPDGRNPGQ